MKPKVLFICSLLGGRSRIAEAFARLDAGELLDAESACLEQGELRKGLPFEVMREIGVELPQGTAVSVFDRYRDGERYDYVVTLCDGATSAVCPLFHRNMDTLYGEHAERIIWNIADFRNLPGSESDQLECARLIRDEIRTLVRDLALRIQRELVRGPGERPAESAG